jgi:hypothetical protein
MRLKESRHHRFLPEPLGFSLVCGVKSYHAESEACVSSYKVYMRTELSADVANLYECGVFYIFVLVEAYDHILLDIVTHVILDLPSNSCSHYFVFQKFSTASKQVHVVLKQASKRSRVLEEASVGEEQVNVLFLSASFHELKLFPSFFCFISFSLLVCPFFMPGLP